MTVAALYIDSRGPYPRMAAGETFRVLGPHGEPYCREWGEPRAIVPWDATCDARLYAGPYPVVAHPPCKHWGRLRHLALNEWVCNNPDCPSPREPVTRENMTDYKVGDWEPCIYCDGACYVTSDRDCAPRAVEQVRAYGGVLEHPAGSLLWEHCGLPMHIQGPDEAAHEVPEDLWCAGADDFGGYTIEIDQVEWGHVARKRTWLYLVGVPREALEAPPFPGREPTRSVSGKRGRATQSAHPTWKEQLPRASDTQRRRTPPLFAEYLVRLARAVRK